MERTEKVSEYWDKVYRRFHETSPSRMSVWNEEPTPFFIRLIDFLKFNGIKKILVAGCGDGRNLAPLLDTGFHVTGADASKYALNKCKKYFKGRKNLKIIKSLLESLPFEDSFFDALICDHVLTHIKEIDLVLNEFYRVLRKGGYALIEFTSPHDSTYAKGKKLSDKEFLQNGVYLRYDTPKDIYKMMSKFKILCLTSEHSTDPEHGPGYIRKQRHKHHSYFVLALKG